MKLVWVLIAAALTTFLPPVLCAGEAAKFALLVGVNEYRNPVDPPLLYAEGDVENFKDVLEKQGFRVSLLTGSDATRAKVIGTRDKLLKNLAAQDVLLIAFAGCGNRLPMVDEDSGQAVLDRDGKPLEDSYICPYDAEPRDPHTMLGLSGMLGKLGQHGGVNLILVDASRNDVREPGISGDKFEGRLPANTAMLFSCAALQAGPREVSVPPPPPDDGHGVFFYHVSEGLSGKAKNSRDEVTWGSLVEYVNEAAHDGIPEKARIVPNNKLPHEIKNLAVTPVLAKFTPRITAAAASELLTAPFDEQAAKTAQRQWAKRLDREVMETNSIGMKLTIVPPGEFTMGSPTDEKSRSRNEQQHRVRITKPFFLSFSPVTLGNFLTFYHEGFYKTEAEKDGKRAFGLDANHKYDLKHGYTFWNWGKKQSYDHPVVDVSWNDAQAFCSWLSKKEGKQYRLPTEAEWEYACRAGTETAFNFGSSCNGRQANCSGDSPYGTHEKGPDINNTTIVGMYKPNAFGLYDMHGNVYQWCQDYFDYDYCGEDFVHSAIYDPMGPPASINRVYRGGSWGSSPEDCRSAAKIRNFRFLLDLSWVSCSV